MSKIAERYIKVCLEPYLIEKVAFGPRQFAYLPGRGARDVLAYLVAIWLLAISSGKNKVLIVCSDAAGAFDKVDSKRLLAKLQARGVHTKLLKLLAAWLKKSGEPALLWAGLVRRNST